MTHKTCPHGFSSFFIDYFIHFTSTSLILELPHNLPFSETTRHVLEWHSSRIPSDIV